MTTSTETYECRDCKSEIPKHLVNPYLLMVELCGNCYNKRREKQESEMYSSGTYKRIGETTAARKGTE